MTEVADDAPLTADEILTFGAVVESQVWHTSWLAEKRAPIARAAGRPKFGPVFNDDGVGRAVLIRPCMSRGKRVRGLPPVYTPTMLEANAPVFSGWTMYLDHLTSEMARSRSVREIGGQVLTPHWDPVLEMDDDELYGYQRGGVVSEVWANAATRAIVGNNPDVLHTSISAWPTGGRPGAVPWNTSKRGMVIEGIRRQPQGSVDFVPRGGAGGRLRPLKEGESPDDREWPSVEWSEEDAALVVSVAEACNASATMADTLRLTTSTTADELREALKESAPHLLSAVAEQAPAAAAPPAAAASATPAAPSLTEADVERKIAEAIEKNRPAPALTEEEIREQVEDQIAEAREQATLSTAALTLIESAEGIYDSWKGDLRARYEVRKDGPAAGLIVAEEDLLAEDGRELTAAQVVEARVKADLQRARDRIAEAQGKPRVTGEGDGGRDNAGSERGGKAEEGAGDEFAQLAASIGIVESADDALSIHGVATTKTGD